MQNMTNGNIPKHLIQYSIPLVLGNFFQLTYNAVDSIVVGRYAGKEALAAVGTANPVMNIIIFFISGLCMGAAVLMSEFFGAGKYEKLKKEISTTMIFGLFFTLFLTGCGFLFSRTLLKLLHVPDEILEQSVLYLRIIFLGLIFTFLYNVYAASMRSVGDSKTSLIFLAIASVLNGCLDVIFIALFHMGIVGAALATVIAEAVSAILCAIYVNKKMPLLVVPKRLFHMDKSLLAKTVHYGWATALQQTCLHIGKLLIQGMVNVLGVDVIAAFNAVNRVDDFAFTPEQSIAHGMTTFIAQNRGAGKKERIRKGFRMGLLLEAAYWVLICLITYMGAGFIMNLFAVKEDADLVPLGTAYLQWMAFFYLLPAFTNGLQGFFRGMGKMPVTLVSTTVQMIFRVLFVWILAPAYGMIGIAFACLGGWIAMLLAELPYYFYYIHKEKPF